MQVGHSQGVWRVCLGDGGGGPSIEQCRGVPWGTMGLADWENAGMHGAATEALRGGGHNRHGPEQQCQQNSSVWHLHACSPSSPIGAAACVSCPLLGRGPYPPNPAPGGTGHAVSLPAPLSAPPLPSCFTPPHPTPTPVPPASRLRVSLSAAHSYQARAGVGGCLSHSSSLHWHGDRRTPGAVYPSHARARAALDSNWRVEPLPMILLLSFRMLLHCNHCQPGSGAVPSCLLGAALLCQPGACSLARSARGIQQTAHALDRPPPLPRLAGSPMPTHPAPTPHPTHTFPRSLCPARGRPGPAGARQRC